jgi:hypothetical protein
VDTALPPDASLPLHNQSPLEAPWSPIALYWLDGAGTDASSGLLGNPESPAGAGTDPALRNTVLPTNLALELSCRPAARLAWSARLALPATPAQTLRDELSRLLIGLRKGDGLDDSLGFFRTHLLPADHCVLLMELQAGSDKITGQRMFGGLTPEPVLIGFVPTSFGHFVSLHLTDAPLAPLTKVDGLWRGVVVVSDTTLHTLRHLSGAASHYRVWDGGMYPWAHVMVSNQWINVRCGSWISALGINIASHPSLINCCPFTAILCSVIHMSIGPSPLALPPQPAGPPIPTPGPPAPPLGLVS